MMLLLALSVKAMTTSVRPDSCRGEFLHPEPASLSNPEPPTKISIAMPWLSPWAVPGTIRYIIIYNNI
jgi:hypothetical protein